MLIRDHRSVHINYAHKTQTILPQNLHLLC